MTISNRIFPFIYRGPAGAFAEYICMAEDGETHEMFAVFYPSMFLGKGVIKKETASLVTLARWEREWVPMSDDEIEKASA